MPTRVRVYEQRDRVIALWNLVFADDPPWNDPCTVIDQKLAVQPDLFFVCESKGKIVGTALAGYDGHRGWVHKVATDPDSRHRGVARLLMEAAEKGLASKGCRKLNLQVREGNDGAVSFYEDVGFLIERRISMSKHIGNINDT